MVSARYSWTRRVVSVCWRMLQSWQRNWGHRYWIMIGGLGALMYGIFFFSSRRRHTWCSRDWSSDVCSSDLTLALTLALTISPLRGSGEGGATHGWFAWLALTIGSGTLVGMLFLSFTRLRPDPEHVGVALLGAMLFAAGIGYAADLSPLVVCGLAAALIVNGSPLRRRVRGLLAAGEHLIYGLFLIITGAVLALPTVWVLAAAPILWALRTAAKWAVVRYARDPLQLGAIPPQLGLATTAQGGLAVALGASFLLGDGATSGTGRPLLTTIVVGVVLAQLAAPPLMRLALRPTALTERAPGPELTAESPVD